MNTKPLNATKSVPHYDIAVIGAGIVGLSAALGIAKTDLKAVLIAPDRSEPDGKTSALLAETVSFLDDLGIWDEAKAFAFPLKTMRIIDGTNRLVRAPQTDFNASEIDIDAFGYNVENKKLGALLAEKLKAQDHLQHIKSELAELFPANAADGSGPYTLKTKTGETLTADRIVAADGRNSVARADLGIAERSWSYPQIALVGNFTHTLPNSDTSTEFHTETGPFTLVPLGLNRSSLVCVVNQAGADNLLALNKDELNLRLETIMQSILGKITLEAPLKNFPLGGMVAKQFAKGSVLLAGEAAHVFPPIGAQGLNLGLRDVKAVLDLLSDEDIAAHSDLGQKYHQMRKTDIHTRTASVDILNRSLLSDFLPVQAGRSFGLYALGEISPLRRMMMREGVAPGTGFKNPFERLAEKLRSRRSA